MEDAFLKRCDKEIYGIPFMAKFNSQKDVNSFIEWGEDMIDYYENGKFNVAFDIRSENVDHLKLVLEKIEILGGQYISLF